MEAKIVDLRYRMKDVLKALERNEEVAILYHGEKKGIIVPVKKKSEKKVKEHAFFGMSKEKDTKESVEQHMNTLRGAR